MVYRYATTRIPILTTIRVFLGAATRHATFYTETNVVEMTITSINVIATLSFEIFFRAIRLYRSFRKDRSSWLQRYRYLSYFVLCSLSYRSIKK